MIVNPTLIALDYGDNYLLRKELYKLLSSKIYYEQKDFPLVKKLIGILYVPEGDDSI